MLRDMHPFEKAGLGKQSYKLLGVTINKHQHTGQPGSSCDFCGTAIMYEFWLLSSDGNKFKVGSDCIYRSGDIQLSSTTKVAERKMVNDMRHEKERLIIAQLRTDLDNPAIQAKLTAHPHPIAWRASKGDTLLQWADWMFKYSGNSGKMKVAKAIAKLPKPTEDFKTKLAAFKGAL